MIVTPATPAPARHRTDVAPAGDPARPPGARDVVTYLQAELAAMGVRDTLLEVSRDLAVLSVSADLAVWTNGARAWWRDGPGISSHRVTRLADLRRLVIERQLRLRRRAVAGHGGQGGASAARPVEELRAAGERLGAALQDHGIVRQDMDVFLESRAAVLYTYGERARVTIAVADGTYSWPAPAGGPGCLRRRTWHDVTDAAAEIAGQLAGPPSGTGPR